MEKKNEKETQWEMGQNWKIMLWILGSTIN
jgi:hypothetical protein